MAGTSSISGVISGLDTSGILSQLREVEMSSVYRLQAQQKTLNERLSNWQTFNTKLLSLKTAISSLTLTSAYNERSVSVSDETVISATATSSALEGNVTFTVVSLAQAHQITSQGYGSEETLVGDGAITINGQEITTDGLSLAELRDAINAADAGVRAMVMNTGLGETPYQLILTSQTTGADGEISYTVNTTGGTPPTFTTLAAAQDAHIQIGSGESALDVYRSSNHIDDIWTGVTLDLKQASPSPVTISIATNTAGISEKVTEFVDAYNEVMKFVDEQQKFDVDTEISGPLFGDSNLLSIQDRLYRAISNPVEGTDPQFSLLSQVGIRRNMEGELAIDQAAFEEALKANPDDILKLLASHAESASAGVTFAYATAETQPSGTDGYSLEITQAASRAWVTAGVSQVDVLAADETLTLNGIDILLTAGMTQQAIIDAINAMSSQTGVLASATGPDGAGSGNHLTLTRTGYGSTLEINVVSDTSNSGAGTSGIGSILVTQASPAGESGAGVGAPGADVAGLIDGIEAEGSGLRLTATSGDAQGLSLIVTADVGVKEPVVFTRGAFSLLNDELITMLETSGGSYRIATDSIQNQIEALDDDIAHAESLVDAKMERLERQFAAMEGALAKLQSQSSYLQSQLAQLSNND